MSKNGSNGARIPKAPQHLQKATRRWWRDVVQMYRLDPHHVKLLTLAAEAFDRCVQARQALERDGAFVADRFGVLKAHPGVAVERDSRVAFCRCLRELDLDVEPPATPTQPPQLRRYSGGK